MESRSNVSDNKVRGKVVKEVFIIGSKGIPAQYGGFETFVENLTAKKQRDDIHYHVACMGDKRSEREYNNAHCFKIEVPNIGPAKAVYYDIAAFKYCLKYIEIYKIKEPIVYVLACRIGPFIGSLNKKLEKLGGTLYVNPDGHEWKRAKWNWMIRKYWKLSERFMVKHAALLVCDSKNIQNYINNDYRQYKPKTTFIAYGTNLVNSTNKEKLTQWLQEKNLSEKGYYLIVGRFVPENNYETMIREFMKSTTRRSLVVITNVEHNKFYNDLKEKTHFDSDHRIKFVGTVYDSELLSLIRENAYAYFHGHEVGGTNPSLLEALASTDLNLLLDVGFNREVGEEGALYWSKTPGSLCKLISEVETLSDIRMNELSAKAKERMTKYYSWENITTLYEKIFME